MARPKKLMFGGTPVMQHPGKGSRMLPGRGALKSLSEVPGGPSLADYSKVTPSGRGAPGSYADIEHMEDPEFK